MVFLFFTLFFFFFWLGIWVAHLWSFLKVELLVFGKSMLLKVLHVLINVYQVLLYVLLNRVAETVHCFCKFCIVFPYHFLIFFELFLNMSKEISKQLLIVYYQFVNYCFMKICTWEFIRITFVDDWSEVGKVLWDDRCTSFHNEIVLYLDIL